MSEFKLDIFYRQTGLTVSRKNITLVKFIQLIYKSNIKMRSNWQV